MQIAVEIDNDTYEALKKRADEEHRSVEEIANETLSTLVKPRPRSIKDFSFIGMGASTDGDHHVSEHVHEAYAEAIAAKKLPRE
jgi:plasmid stability protein